MNEMSMNVKYPIIIKMVTLPAASVYQNVTGLFQSVSQLFENVSLLFPESFPMVFQCFSPVCCVVEYLDFRLTCCVVVKWSWRGDIATNTLLGIKCIYIGKQKEKKFSVLWWSNDIIWLHFLRISLTASRHHSKNILLYLIRACL